MLNASYNHIDEEKKAFIYPLFRSCFPSAVLDAICAYISKIFYHNLTKSLKELYFAWINRVI